MIPKGFSFSAVNVGIKSPAYEGLDLGLISCSTQAVLSGVFTRNLVKAAPVLIGMDLVKKGTARAIIANAGNANACTGQQGLDDAHVIQEAAASGLGVMIDDVIPMSTGTIGVMMPVDRILPKIPGLVKGVSNDKESFARSIMTTDTFPKIVSKRAGEACVLGFAKGAGMIAPNMATTLAVVLTDATIDKQHLDIIINNAIDQTFNAITIDGDMSTNDTLIALASGLVQANFEEISNAITEVIRELSLMIVQDGEGATKFVTIMVSGANTNSDARTIAMAVANSLLVKTALFGADPNWGRIVAAVGYAGVLIDPANISVHIQGLKVVENTMESPTFSEEELHQALAGKEITIHISVGNGPGRFTAWTTDLSYRYVEINAQYRT
jgi:glutamate N-acetyltransferase / amino-acid N-acetyltransferase